MKVSLNMRCGECQFFDFQPNQPDGLCMLTERGTMARFTCHVPEDVRRVVFRIDGTFCPMLTEGFDHELCLKCEHRVQSSEVLEFGDDPRSKPAWCAYYSRLRR